MKIKFCHHCGKKLALSDAFCNSCGTRQHNLDLDNYSENYNTQYNAPNNYSTFNAMSNNAPTNGMNFGKAIELFWKNAFSLSGCSSRSEFWFSYLFSALINIFLFGVVLISYDPLIESFMGFRILKILLVLAVVVFFFNEIAYISAVVRRLHDTNLSGGFFWVFLVPIIGGIILLILLCQPSNPAGVTKFGERDNTEWYKQESAWIALVICSFMFSALVIHVATIDYHERQYEEVRDDINLENHHDKSSDDEDSNDNSSDDISTYDDSY